jgi:hypothetical protein
LFVVIMSFLFPPADPTAAEEREASIRPATQAPQEREHPQDDDVLSSIRTVRKMVEQEFDQASRRRKRTTRLSSNGLLERQPRKDSPSRGGDEATNDDGSGESNANKGDDDQIDDSGDESWKDQCFRLKQELFEEKNHFASLVERHKDELAQLSWKMKEARKEASRDRDLRAALVSTLEAQTKHSSETSRQLADSRENKRALQTMWKDLVQTMEEEKESMDKERETSLALLEETQKRLAASLTAQHRAEEKASATAQLLGEKEQELESANEKLTTSVAAHEGREAVAKAAKGLQQKLRELEDVLAKDAETIRLLERQIAVTPVDPNAESLKQATKAFASPSSVATKKNQLNEKKIRLRTKSLSVLGDVIRLQLQRLTEIHGQATTTGGDAAVIDDEWKSILEKLSQNRVRMFELKKDAEPKTRGDRGQYVGEGEAEGSPMKRSKTAEA